MKFALNQFVITPQYDGDIKYPKVLPEGNAIDGSFLHLNMEAQQGFDSIYLTVKKTDF
jgi:hypothetical protein